MVVGKGNGLEAQRDVRIGHWGREAKNPLSENKLAEADGWTGGITANKRR